MVCGVGELWLSVFISVRSVVQLLLRQAAFFGIMSFDVLRATWLGLVAE